MKTKRLVCFNSREGISRLESTPYKGAFYQLAPHFQPQRDPYYCAVATAVIGLNALRSPKSSKPFSQDNLLSAATDRIRPRQTIRGPHPGLTLTQLALLLRHFGLKVKVQIENLTPERGAARLRKLGKSFRSSGNPLCLANFSYGPLFGQGGGHFSPLAAYHSSSDSILVLDVANHKTLWYWAPTELLTKAMSVVDESASSPRGLLLVSPGD